MQEKTREKILHSYQQNTSRTFKNIADDCDVPLTTTLRVINKYLLTGIIKRKIGSGRKHNSGNKKLAQKVVLSITRKIVAQCT